MDKSKQLLIGNISEGDNDVGSKGTFEKYHSEHVILESTPRLTIVNNPCESDVTLEGKFIATAFHARSDERVKENIYVIKDPLSIVNKIEGKCYNFKHKKDKTSYGFIAQEIEEVLPDIVDDDKEGLKSISYGEIIPILSNAIKELDKKVNELTKRLKDTN